MVITFFKKYLMYDFYQKFCWTRETYFCSGDLTDIKKSKQTYHVHVRYTLYVIHYTRVSNRCLMCTNVLSSSRAFFFLKKEKIVIIIIIINLPPNMMSMELWCIDIIDRQ